MDSLDGIIENCHPDIVVLNEVKLRNSGKIHTFFKKKGYEIIIRNSGGVVIAALVKFKIMNVTTSQNPRILAGLLPDLNVSIVTAYGPQENVPKEERQEFFDDLSIEIQKTLFANTDLVLAGDLNSKIEVSDNRKIGAISSNGEMLLDILNSLNLEVMNFKSLCSGYWTRVQNVNGVVNKSVIDYCITNSTFSNNLQKMVIDEEKVLCPFRVKKANKEEKEKSGGTEYTHQYSDHNSLLMDFRVRYKESKQVLNSQVKRWNITTDGLKEFSKITSSDESLHLTSVSEYQDLEQELDRVMDSCFKRKKKNVIVNSNKNRITENRFKEITKVLIDMLRKGKAEKKVAKVYLEHLKQMQLENVQQQRSMRLKATMEELQDGKGNMSPDDFYRLRRGVLGKTEERTSLINDEGVEVFDEASIINEYRNEFLNRLSHRKINPAFKECETITNRLLHMSLTSSMIENSQPDYTFEEVSTILHNLKNGKAYPDAYPPEMFKFAGKNLVIGITKTLNAIKNKLMTPKEWAFMIIKTLFKNKGSRKKLKYHRGIFLTAILSKVLERLMLVRSEKNTGKINPLQCGSTKEMSGSDNIFIMNSLIDHALYLDKTLFVTSYDYQTCFDSLWLEECLLALIKLGVDSHTVKLLYELNKEACIKVKTPFGDTKPFSMHNFVKQGTVWGSKLCCATTAEICDEDDIGGASVGEITIRSMLYVDDSNRFNMNTLDTVSSHDKFINLSAGKRSPLNAEKCVILPINKKPLDATPILYIDGEVMKEVKETKILGDHFNHKGNKETLIDARVKASKGITVNIIAMCNEATFGLFCISASLLLYGSVFVPSVIHNSQAWSNITGPNYDDLRTAQLKCLKRILKVASSTPNHFVFLELGALPIDYEIHIKQLGHLHHILSPN